MEYKPQEEELFVKASELTIEKGQVTISNPELVAALEEFAASDPKTPKAVGQIVVSW